MSNPPAASRANELIASRVSAAFGGAPHFTTYTARDLEFQIDILACRDRPAKGLSSFSTIGLSDHPMIGPAGEFRVRLELVGACENSIKRFPDLLASAGFWVVRTGGVYFPGVVILNGVQEVVPSATLQHIYLTNPFLWQDQLKTLDCGSKQVAWLMVLPISDSERIYLIEKGMGALENRFEERAIDIFDLKREPVV